MKRNSCFICLLSLIILFFSVLPSYNQGINQKTGSRNKPVIPEIPGMVYVEEGEFIAGSSTAFDYESPQHIVSLKGFYIDKYEVTNQQYKKFIDATGYPAPIDWRNNTFRPGEDSLPVVNISYYNALAYAKWAGKRLPTEQEWEKTARYNDGRRYPWGNTWRKTCANVRPVIGFSKLKPIGSYPDGVSKYGAYDMAGNVWEWTDSSFLPYPGNKVFNQNYNEKNKVIRGGSYRQSELIAECCRRDFLEMNSTRTDVGFRCAK